MREGGGAERWALMVPPLRPPAFARELGRDTNGHAILRSHYSLESRMADTTKKQRTSPGKSGEAVLKEYNHRCSVCGEDRPQIHHIDENPSNQDPFNLLPLCPNCHLSDQHNPTAKVDHGLLKLFRKYKDPTILSPQFIPLFQRIRYLDSVDEQSLDSLLASGDELIGFVAELEMGQFYARRLSEVLEAPSGEGIYVLPESYEERVARERRAQERRERYGAQLTNAKSAVTEIVIELLRYQSWRLASGKNDARHYKT